VGESYVQEAVAKLPRVLAQLEAAGTPPPRRHFVGRLQRNKARDAVRWFDVIQSVDRAALAQEIGRRAEAAGRDLDVLLQVNLAGELQKAGAPPEALPELLGVCAAQRRLRVVGLMTLPPASPDPEQSRPFFARLRALSDDLRRSEAGADLVQLSMGMSADFEVAIEEGATLVRVGTALFGPREV
jgi:pyridoxal phosphate enzyme (YggS family)